MLNSTIDRSSIPTFIYKGENILLLAEIGLTIWACIKLGKAKKGWALGLLPVAGAVLGGILMGALGAAASTIIIVDVIAVGILIWIIATTKSTAPPTLK
jgi:hypothetical protein